MFSCEFCEISKNIFSTEHLQKTASSFSFLEAATRGCSMKKGVLENLRKFTGKQHLWFAKFSKTPFYRPPLDDCFWLFRATLLKLDTVNSVWKTSYEYSLSRNTNLRSTVQVRHFFFQHKLVFSRFFDIRGNLGNVKDKPTRKTCFSPEMKRQALRMYLAKFC